MKRIVTLVVSGDMSDGANLSEIVADILDRHARDIRDKDNIAGCTAMGSLSGRLPVPWAVEWSAIYDE